MSNYFINFPIVKYRFGDAEDPSLFQHIGSYIDLIDQVVDVTTSYEDYYVAEHERPDVVSHKLYGNSNYGWTFFLLNEKLRVQGWPVSNLEIYNLADRYYPNIVLSTNDNISKNLFVREGSVVEAGTSLQQGKVLRINYDLGQIFIDRSSFFPTGVNTIHDVALGPEFFVKYTNQRKQTDAVHHFEDADGNIIDFYDSHSQDETKIIFKNASSLRTVTYLDRLIKINEDLKNIKVFKPTVIGQIVAEFNRLMLGSNNGN